MANDIVVDVQVGSPDGVVIGNNIQTGAYSTFEIVEVVTGEPGTLAEAINLGTKTAVKLKLVIPQGKQGRPGDKGDPGYTPIKGKDYRDGDKGDPGNGIESIELVSGEHAPGTLDTYRITLTDGNFYDVHVYNGADGEGMGDMVSEVYDPQGRCVDIFQYTDNKIAAIPTPDVSKQIDEHNVSTAAHNDLRLLIAGLAERLNALANSDDATLDQMAEVVEYIKDNRELIEQVTTGKVSVSDIVDNLTTNVSNKPLSAAQGVALKSLVDALTTAVNGKEASGTAASAVGSHNANGQAHSDIRELASTAQNTANNAATAASNAASAASAAQATASGKASTATYTVSVNTSWSQNSAGGFYKTVSVSGMLATDNPIADVVLGSDVDANILYLEAWALVTRISTAANSITLYAHGDAPATAFTIQLKAVR